MADGIEVKIEGLPEFEATLAAIVVRVQIATDTASKAGGERLVEEIHKHMTGRPGPNKITGRLYDSVKSTPERTSGIAGNIGGWASQVVVDTDYAARIEFGFNGTDSIGRRYNQPKYPYFTPAVQESGLLELFRVAWTEALQSNVT